MLNAISDVDFAIAILRDASIIYDFLGYHAMTISFHRFRLLIKFLK
jgi:hypothetical protein